MNNFGSGGGSGGGGFDAASSSASFDDPFAPINTFQEPSHGGSQQQPQRRQQQGYDPSAQAAILPAPLMDSYDPLGALFSPGDSSTSKVTTNNHHHLNSNVPQQNNFHTTNFDPLTIHNMNTMGSLNTAAASSYGASMNHSQSQTGSNNPQASAYAAQLAAVAAQQRTATNHHRQNHHQTMMAASAWQQQPLQQPPQVLYQSQQPQQPFLQAPHQTNRGQKRSRSQAQQHSPPKNIQKKKAPPQQYPQWLQDLELDVKGISIEPTMKGPQVMARLNEKLRHVITRYLPCVDFLVACQQDLRKGIASASRSSQAQRYFQTYIAPLPQKFATKYGPIMESDHLQAARKDLQTLVQEAKAYERTSSEAVKNAFLGGMKDGESWGLRKWLSKHGGALHICNDCECILQACQALDRSLTTTNQLAARIRPPAAAALKRLRAEIPASYQEISTAHPYLPFFHRLETALKHLSEFDPDDDDVICIDDDDEIQVLKTQAAAKPKAKFSSPAERKREREKKKKEQAQKSVATTLAPVQKQQPQMTSPKKNNNASSIDENHSVIDLLDLSPQTTNPKKKKAKTGLSTSTLSLIDDDDNDSYMKKFFDNFDKELTYGDSSGIDGDDAFIKFGGQSSPSALRLTAFDLALSLGRLAAMFDGEDGQQQSSIRPSYLPQTGFWDIPVQYAKVLRMFSDVLKSNDAELFLDPASEGSSSSSYSTIIKHPLCFRDIVSALLEESYDGGNQLVGSNGRLPALSSLANWNMWIGSDLLQAIDLVLVNYMAFAKATLDEFRRSKAQKLRREVWAGIKTILNQADLSEEERKKCTPTRRGESSGFVVHK